MVGITLKEEKVSSIRDQDECITVKGISVANVLAMTLNIISDVWSAAG